MSIVMVTMRHVQVAKGLHGGYCARGVSQWLQQHGLSLRELVRVGYPAEVIEGFDDEFSNKVAQIARKEQVGES
jgi:hypothetical protein